VARPGEHLPADQQGAHAAAHHPRRLGGQPGRTLRQRVQGSILRNSFSAENFSEKCILKFMTKFHPKSNIFVAINLIQPNQDNNVGF
jgi:hypothetical protein